LRFAAVKSLFLLSRNRSAKQSSSWVQGIVRAPLPNWRRNADGTSPLSMIGPDMVADFPAHQRIADRKPSEFILNHAWEKDEALIIVSRHYEIDRDALRAALERDGMGYLGMIGSQRKVRRVFDQLRAQGVVDAQLRRVFAPIGLNIGSDAPAEIAISVLAEVLQTLRGRPGGHMRMM
jgi:xanthine/CO dehydrogenase XdhC/CoxF family maturation factor